MKTVIVNDASCLIDLRKGGLLHAVVTLPYRFVIPYPIRHSELLEFTSEDWRTLENGGLEIFDLPSNLVEEAQKLRPVYPQLSLNDRFCLTTAGAFEAVILLTGDNALRKAATARKIRTHGVLWVIDELEAAAKFPSTLLVSALEIWAADRAVFLPSDEVDARLKRLKPKR